MKSNYLLTENLTSTISVYLILKRLMLPWEDWGAYKLGIIDKNGKKLKHPISSKERNVWDILDRFCWNLKKITDKFIGNSKLAHNFVAAMLLRDSLNDYIKINQIRLNETLLADMNYNTQSIIYETLNTYSNDSYIKHYNLSETTQDNLEFLIYKQLNIAEETLQKNPKFRSLFEDGEVVASVGTTTADIAQPMSILGVEHRKQVKPKKKLTKKKRTFTK